MRLRRHREARGLSIDALADAAGVASRQLIRVEHGKASASVLWILDVARALDLDPGELFHD
jgi:transcriptional regulator with XRE-family HTH domain